MAGLEDTINFISDDTMAGLPSVIHSDENDNSINNTGHDMFETTMIPTPPYGRTSRAWDFLLVMKSGCAGGRGFAPWPGQ